MLNKSVVVVVNVVVVVVVVVSVEDASTDAPANCGWPKTGRAEINLSSNFGKSGTSPFESAR